MTKNQNEQHDNADAADGLRGGTQTDGTSALIRPGGDPGGTNSLTPTGTSHPAGHAAEPPTGDKAAAERQDPQRIEGGRTAPSESAVKQRARDEANVEGSTSGIDADSPRQIPTDAPNPDGRTGND